MRDNAGLVMLLLSMIFVSTMIIQVNTQQLDKLRSSAIKERTFLIPITDNTQFQELVLKEKTQPILMFFTVGPDRIEQCPYCSIFKKIYIELAKKATNERLYWTIVEFDANTQMIAQQLQVQHVPGIALFLPGKPPIKLDLASEQIPHFIQQHTGISIEMTEEEMMKIMTSDPVMKQAQQQAQQQQQGQSNAGTTILHLFRLSFKIIFLAVFSGVLLTSAFYTKYLSRRTLLAFACYIVFIICIGGVVYNMIHQTELFHHNPYTGQTAFIYPEMRAQFGLEGYFSAGCMILAGVCFVAMTQLLPLVESSAKRRLIGLLLYAMFWLSFGSIFIIFCLKMPSYFHGSSVHAYVTTAHALFGGE